MMSPFVTAWVVGHEADAYRAKFGVDAEGMGFFAIILAGAFGAFTLFSMATANAVLAYRALPAPRTPFRKIELSLMCLPPLAVIAFIYFGMLGGPYDPPQLIQTH
jgi:hypothetical protein